MATKKRKTAAKPPAGSPIDSRRPNRPASRQPVANVLQLTRRTWRQLWQHRGLFLAIVAIYGVLSLILVQGLASSGDVTSLKSELNHAFTGSFASLASGLTVFAVLVGTAGNGSSNTAGAYQFFLTLIASLAIIWALRQTAAGNRVRLRDAYYRGMYPLIPFILVLLVIALQLLPLLIGTSLYSLVNSNGIAVLALEKLAWAALAIGLSLVSLYFVSSSILALYIVTLPDMTPLAALRSAKALVKGRRWLVVRKLLFLLVLLLVLAAVIMLPIIIWLTALAQWIFFVLTMLALLAAHGYIYSLYRELLNE